MSPKYFQGKTVTGQVEASEARTFRDVIERFQLPAKLDITRSAFLLLDKKSRNEIKQVPFFVAACFSESPSRRDTPHATSCNLIFVDVDETEDGQCPAAPFVRDTKNIFRALEGFNFAAHVTASSTPEKPRMRVVVDAREIPLALYPQAVQTLWSALGLPSGPRSGIVESKKAVQPMFLPTIFQDSGPDDYPLIAHNLEARAFTVADITQAAPSVNGTNGKNGHRHPEEQADRSDQLFFLRSPVPEISLAVAREALEHVEADCSYFEWMDVAFALRHQFSPLLAEEAYQLFDEWSSEGARSYKDSKATRAKWDSAHLTPAGRMPVTIRTLLHRAALGGWDDKKVKEQGFNAVLQWMGKVSSITELMEQGIQHILSTPQLSAAQEGMLVDQLRVHAKDRFMFKVSSTDIRKDIAALKAKIRAQEHSPDSIKVPTWAKGVCFVSAAGDFFRHSTGEKYKTESFNAIYGRHLLPTAEQLQRAGQPVTEAALCRPQVAPSDYALNHLEIPTAYDYAYDPSQPTTVHFVNGGRKFVNVYCPTYPELDPHKAGEAGEFLQRHLRNLVAEADHRRTIVDFLAFQVQQPGRKVRWAVLIQGAEGCGKSYLAETMKAVLGHEHVKTISGAVIRSDFNDWAFGYQMVVIEEVRASGTNRHDTMNALKEPITNPTIPINEKFRNSRMVDNISNYMLFSNHHDALTLTPQDRRYFVIKSPLQTKAQVLALGDDYFPKLFGMLRDHPGAVRAYLNEWEISPDFRADGHAPRTKYTDDMVADSASDLTAAIRRLLLEGDHPLVQYDIVSNTALMNLLLLEDGLHRPSAQAVSQVLREEAFVQVGRHLLGEERHYLWSRHVDPRTVPAIAHDRVKGNKKNLQMEMFL